MIFIFAVESKVSDGRIVNLYETPMAFIVEVLGVTDIV